MTYDEFCKLNDKMDTVLDKLDGIGQRVSSVETKQYIYCKIVNWSTGTVILIGIGLIGFLAEKALF